MAYSIRDYLIKISSQIEGLEEGMKGLQDLAKQVQATKKEINKDDGGGSSGGKGPAWLVKLRTAAEKCSAVIQKITTGVKKVFGVIGKIVSPVVNFGRRISDLTTNIFKQAIGFTTLTNAIVNFIERIKSAAKEGISLQDNIEETAKSLNKTVEQTRAHNIALSVMGKTMEEINKSKSLKATYNDLVKLGESMRLPDSAKGLSAVNDLTNAFAKLRVVGRYALQWIYYYFQRYLTTTLQKNQQTLSEWTNSLMEKVQPFAKKVAEIIARIYNIAVRLINTFRRGLGFIKNMIGSMSKESLKGLLAVIAILTTIFDKSTAIKAIFAGIILLFDDLLEYLDTGDSRFKAIHEFLIGLIAWIYNAIMMVLGAIIDLVNFVERLFGGNDFQIEFSYQKLTPEMVKSFLSKGLDAGSKNKGGSGEGSGAAQGAGTGYEGYAAEHGYAGTNYVTGGVSNSNNTTYNTTVNAPATINVTGSDPTATAAAANEAHADVVTRNLDSAIA